MENHLDIAKKLLEKLWWQGVHAVQGEKAVINHCEKYPIQGAVKAIAVGKAAISMINGLHKAGVEIDSGLVVTKKGLATDELQVTNNIKVIESSHPVPDESSVKAGEAVLEFVRNCGPEDHLVLLVSGGASSLAEKPVNSYVLADLQEKTKILLQSGATINEINVYRSNVSEIKGGKLHTHFTGKNWTTLAISDVQGDDIQVIGSGIGWTNDTRKPYQSYVIGSNQIVRNAAEKASFAEGFTVVQNEEMLYGDVFRLAKIVSDRIHKQPKGISIFGGEPTIKLPAKVGVGGRNQSLALALAIEISGEKNIALLVGGTDGNDGPTCSAGGLITGKSVSNLNRALDALRKADAGSYLKTNNSLFVSGGTDTNVMDLLIAYRW